MDFMQEYEKWLHSPALSPEEHAELESIKDDPKEIESRFFGPLEFGTAGLRGGTEPRIRPVPFGASAPDRTRKVRIPYAYTTADNFRGHEGG